MSDKPLPIELAQSQVHFASNLENGTTRRSDYLKSNFQITKDRENQVNERSAYVHVKSSTMNLDDYFAGLKANDQFDSQGNGNLYLKEDYKANKLTFVLHCLLLIAAVVCGSSIGIFYYDIQPESQILKASWRMLFLAICMSPFAIYEYIQGKETYIYSKEVLWNKNTWKGILWASIGRVAWAIALIISVNHTSIAQANLFINVHPILLMLFKMRARPSLLMQEKIGGIFVIAGIILVLLDNQIGSSPGFVDLNNIGNLRRIFSGNMIALLGSVGGALYFTKDQQLKNEYPFFLYTVLVSLIGFALTSAISIIFESSTISFNPENGIFGVFTGERIGIYILLILVTGFGTYFGYRIASQYFQPLFLSLALNTEPIFAMLLVSILGWQTFPALLTIIAFCLFIPGTMMVTLGNKEVEVMEYDILDDGTGSYGQMSFIEPRLARAPSMVRQYKMSSAVAPISWER